MNRLVISLLAVVALLAGLAYALREPITLRLQYEPLLAEGFRAGGQPLPENTVVLSASEIEDVTTPLERRRDIAASSGYALVLPEGAGESTSNGVARFAVTIPEPGAYYAWMRTRWNDECANSCTFRIDGNREFIVGQDAVYNTWHWTPAGRHELTNSLAHVQLSGREDGIAIDQVLFTPDTNFEPTGAIRDGAVEPDLRRFADDFNRSPGHGLEPWEIASGEWEILFDLDPNRIPLQYALRGNTGSAQEPARIRAGGRQWDGVELRTQIYMPAQTTAGVALIAEQGPGIDIELVSGEQVTDLAIRHDGRITKAPLPEPLPCEQWYSVTVERWAWLLLVSIDGERVYAGTDWQPARVQVGLVASGGQPSFDDFSVCEIPWIADGRDVPRLAWQPRAAAAWYRPRHPGTGSVLHGRHGSVAAPDVGLAPRAVWVEEEAPSPTDLQPLPVSNEAVGSGRLGTFDQGTPPDARVELARTSPGDIRRIAIAYGRPPVDRVRIGPYHFSSRRAEDPSDYMEFTEEEIHEMASSEEADKLRRKERQRTTVGRGTSSFWRSEKGLWTVRDGGLRGIGAGSRLRHWLDVVADMTVSLRVRMASTNSVAGLGVYGDAGEQSMVWFGAGAQGTGTEGPATHRLHIPADGEWHTLRFHFEEDTLRATVDGANAPGLPRHVERGSGGRLHLAIEQGGAFFDDVMIEMPRDTGHSVVYAFDRRESDWLRSGPEWTDHGGIACVLASSWISMETPEGPAYIWNKRSFGPDVMVAFRVEEFSRWYGWKTSPSHTHYPFDNITAVLGTTQSPDSGYRLEVNADNRSRTVLYRDGIAVAERGQGSGFPVRFVGGHAPYTPRSMRLSLVKHGATVRAYVEGVEVLEFTDPDPIEVSTVGLGGRDTHANFSHITVRELRAQVASAPLLSAASRPVAGPR